MFFVEKDTGMNFKRIIIGIITGISIFLIIHYSNSSVSENKGKIGILQTASHPALDACRKEFIQRLSDISDIPYEYIVKNGEGSLINLHSAAQELQMNSDIKFFYVIASPALQTLAALEKERPIVFAAVTDPSLLIDQEHKNVTGISDAVETKTIIDNVLSLVPQPQTVGLVYNPSEINSIYLVKEFEQHLKNAGKSSLHVTITSEAEVSQAVINALGRVDVLLAPTDNLVANTAPLIAQLAHENNKPFIVSDLKLIDAGPLAALGISYEICGQEAAEMGWNIIAQGTSFTLPAYKKTTMQKGIINIPVFKDLKLPYNDNLKNMYNFFPSHATLDE